MLGFALLTFGFLSIVLSMIGLQLSFLTWLDNSSRLIGFVIRIGMVLVGIIMMALATTDWEREFRESSEP